MKIICLKKGHSFSDELALKMNNFHNRLQMSLATSCRTCFCWAWKRFCWTTLFKPSASGWQLSSSRQQPKSARSPALRPLTRIGCGAGFRRKRRLMCVCGRSPPDFDSFWGDYIGPIDSKRNDKSTRWHTSHSLPFQLRFHSLSASTPVNFLVHILISVLKIKVAFTFASCP